MKKVGNAAILVVVTLAMLTAGCDRNGGGDAGQGRQGLRATAQTAVGGGTIDRSHKGTPLPDFTFSDPAGRKLQLTSLRGKPVLINLWATWCGPCVQEMPTLDRIAGENAAMLRIVTVSQDAPGAPVADFFRQNGLARLEPWLDPEGKLDIHYGTGSLPTSVFYDSEGREVWRLVGTRDWTTDETTALLLEGTLQ